MSRLADNSDPRRRLPSVDAVLNGAQGLIDEWGHTQVSELARAELLEFRAAIGRGEAVDITVDQLVQCLGAKLADAGQSTFRQLINLSGTVIHTNLGRAVLPQRAIDAVVSVAQAPSNLEFDLATGNRGERDTHVESLICELTGAEAATVVNNNAAAVLLVLSTLASKGEVPVSRGELVEIGGAFRIPEVMERSGCKLIEIGATNRTHLSDYEGAINDRTSLIMKVHTSNFKVEGFTKSVGEVELAELAHERQLPFVIDLGSGNLVDFAALGLPDEPTVAQSIDNGADVVTFSGDKLLGGPQCGIIAGRKDLISQIRKNPLKRALRLDKMTLAALAEVLKLYRSPERLREELPTLRFLTREVSQIKSQASRVQTVLKNILPDHYRVEAIACQSQIGSGALPVESIESFGLAIRANTDAQLRQLVSTMRNLPRPVIGRLNDGVLTLDLRCLDCEEIFVQQLVELAAVLE
ncbi:MAG: L-seryl-tRNA(Ser) seleniumtransferase [Halioglobus sp.]|jgi:L-seryl-tRNA(Ser) seleniumtransferase